MATADTPIDLLNARYIAIRTAEAKGLTDRLLEASRDETPGVRRVLLPLLYRFWHNNREQGWTLLERIAEGSVRFPGLLNRRAIETFGQVTMPILSVCRDDPEQLERLAALWQAQMDRLLGSPLARTARMLGRRWVLRTLSSPLADVLKRQPSYQPVNYAELVATFARPDEARAAWRDALGCLERPDTAPQPIVAILSQTDRPFDLYLMLACERALIFYGARTDPAGAIEVLERLFHSGCAWFRQSVLYALFHILSHLPSVEDAWLDRYEALTREFFVSGSWRMRTAAGQYTMATHVAGPDVVADRHRPGRPPRVVPEMLEHAVAAGDEEGIAGLFAAIDGVAFYHNNGALALAMIERARALGGGALEARVLASLASVRLQDQPLVEAVLEQRRSFAGISAADVAGVEPSITEEDLITLIDGFFIHMMLTSDGFRGQVCDAFRRAVTAHSVEEFLVQILEWLRDGLAVVRSAKG